MHVRPHLRLPHLPVPAVVLSVVYLAAIAVALATPGRPTLAGLVVLAGLTTRWLAHARRPDRTGRSVPSVVLEAATTVDAARTNEPEAAPAPAVA